MRLFVAIEPPDAVLDEVAGLVSRLSAGGAGAGAAGAVRWTRREHWHLTVAFLGEVPDDRLPQLTGRLERSVARHPALELGLAGGGSFAGRTLWSGVRGDLPELDRLARSVAAAARRSGIDVERRTYRPHLTLARSRSPVDLGPWVALLEGWAGAPWRVEQVGLVRSRLGPTVSYQVLDRIALRG